MNIDPDEKAVLKMDNQDEVKDAICDDEGGEDQTDGGKVMFYAQRSTRLQKLRFYYQHPYFRIFVSYFVILCNFFIYAEDPVAHSKGKCEIPVVGNAFSFVATKYPPNGFSFLKILMWLSAIVVGIVIGKLLIHHLLFKKLFKLSMFSNDQGSWMVSFLVTILVLIIFSVIYNAFLSLDSSMDTYRITGYIGAKNTTFMRAAALGTWGGDFITAWMVTDMMLQDVNKYPNWAVSVRQWWNKGLRRVIFFWVFAIFLTIIVVIFICTDLINWDKLNRDVFYTNELGRAFLASFILVMDFTIVMQDWDFPLFQANLDVKLPGLNTANIRFNIPQCLRRRYWTVHITGKWFNYGILFFVMILDLNMWKNQIFYAPLDYAQYTGPDDHIYSVQDKYSLSQYKNATIYSYGWRSNHTNPFTNVTFLFTDIVTNSRYRSSPLKVRGLAFIPSIFVFIMFGVLIYIFGREGTEQFETVEFRKKVNITSVHIKQSADKEKEDGRDNTTHGTDSKIVNKYGSTDNRVQETLGVDA